MKTREYLNNVFKAIFPEATSIEVTLHDPEITIIVVAAHGSFIYEMAVGEDDDDFYFAEVEGDATPIQFPIALELEAGD